MGKLRKKNEAGAAKVFINRTQAVKTLQISLREFRRMCILKGIYPRDPKHKSKLSGINKTYYHTKDIKQLVMDPLMASIRKSKTFGKKMRRLQARGEWEMARRFESLNKPILPFPEIIRSRYPTFNDALKDIDDALTHIALFSSLPQTAVKCLNPEVIKSCYRLLSEFSRYVMETHSLRKVFISVKGTYLQAEIHNETITWIIPHSFTLEIPSDVDVRVMATFLELYNSLLSFVNFKLLKEIGWEYPSMVIDGDEDSPNSSVGYMAIKNSSLESNLLSSNYFPPMDNQIDDKVIDEFSDNEEKGADNVNSDETIVSSIIQKNEEKKIYFSLFSDCVFFLSREVPFDVLVLCIVSFGGRVGWNHGPGSPFSESDTRITHNVVDRPVISSMFGGRKYIQPQWIFDSINSKVLLSEELYGPTVTSLPSHLSPFVDDNDDEKEESEIQNEDHETAEIDQAHELALSMMSKKKKKLYEAMQRGIQNKAAEKSRLADRARQAAASQEKAI